MWICERTAARKRYAPSSTPKATAAPPPSVNNPAAFRHGVDADVLELASVAAERRSKSRIPPPQEKLDELREDRVQKAHAPIELFN
jgi:hypothetical protein